MERLRHPTASSEPEAAVRLGSVVYVAHPLRCSDSLNSLSMHAAGPSYPSSRGKQALWLPYILRRVTRRLVFSVFAILCVAGYLVLCAVQYSYRQGPFMWFVRLPMLESLATQLSPPLTEQQLPFVDLCLSAEVMESRLAHAYVVTRQQRLSRRRELERLMNRFEHIPADGGGSATVWSAATGLPVAKRRRGSEVKARFLTASNKLSDYVHIATTAATMAGVRFEVLGLHWKHFSYLKRMGMMLSYAQHEGMTDADVIVGMDSDALFSGEDPYGFIEAFVASTAESLEEHRTYSVRDIRLGKRQPPFLFGSEFNCMRDQATRKDQDICRGPYHALNEMMAVWAAKTNVTLTPDHQEGFNPMRFLNAGVFVARVWALRRWNTALLDFLETHKPKSGKTWWCDQSAMGTMYLELRLWEMLSGALDGTPHVLTAAEVGRSFYPPMVLPTAGSGPHGVPAGLVGYERAGRLVLTVGPEMSEQGVFQIDSITVPRNNASDEVLQRLLQSRPWTMETALAGLKQSSHRLHLTPRNAVDCHGVADIGVGCEYREAVLGMQMTTSAYNGVVPLIWHFAGGGKRKMLTHYRAVFPWYTPATIDAAARNALLWTLVSAPPTRVFAVDTRMDVESGTATQPLLPHDERDDVSFVQMCTYRYYEGW